MEARTTTAKQYHDGTSFRGIAVKTHVDAKPAKPRHVILSPYMSARNDFGAHNNNLPNLIRGLNERVFNVQGKLGLEPTPQPCSGEWRKMTGVAVRLSDRVREFGRCQHLTCEEFIEQCPANKRRLYATAAEQYNRQGWTKRDARIKVFVKFEKLNFTKKGDPAPRVIQPRSPIYNLALGRFTRRVEEQLYHALAEEWGEDGGKVVMKGLTVEEVAAEMRMKWNKFKCPTAVGLDASRFDQHVSEDALKWEHSIYKRIFDYHPELVALLKVQLENEGFAFVDGHKLSYKVSGTRASGDMNTSLGNCIIMCSLVREYLRGIGVNAELANNGDDCLIFMEKSDLYKLVGLSDWFLRYGFEMEVEQPVFEFEECVFCQMQPILVNAATDTWVMCRQPSAAFAKDALSLSVSTELGFRQWSYQVGVGGHALYGDMPIFGELYKVYKREGVDSNAGRSAILADSGFLRLSKTPRVRGDFVGQISDDTRVSFYKAFNYPPSMQIAMECEIRTMSYKGVRNLSENIALSCGLTTI
jgi:hypothetical protein